MSKERISGGLSIVARRVRLVFGIIVILVFNLPTLLTSKATNETMEEILIQYDNVPSSYIRLGIFQLFDYIKLYNIASDANRAISMFNASVSVGASEYLSIVVSKASSWESLEVPNDKLLATIKHGMSLLGKDNDRAQELFNTVMQHTYFKAIIVTKGLCYEIRFKAVGFYYVLILISVVVAGLLVYDKVSSLYPDDTDYLDEDEDIYEDE